MPSHLQAIVFKGYHLLALLLSRHEMNKREIPVNWYTPCSWVSPIILYFILHNLCCMMGYILLSFPYDRIYLFCQEVILFQLQISLRNQNRLNYMPHNPDICMPPPCIDYCHPPSDHPPDRNGNCLGGVVSYGPCKPADKTGSFPVESFTHEVMMTNPF